MGGYGFLPSSLTMTRRRYGSFSASTTKNIPTALMVTPPRILTFRSMAHWKAYIEACKESSQLIVIDFTAVWCGPCKLMDPFLNTLAETFTDVIFVKIDVDELMEVAQQWSIQVMPTFLMLKKGKEVDRVMGAKKDELLKKIEYHKL